jgi:hypothetical protein
VLIGEQYDAPIICKLHFWTKAGRINTLTALKIQDLVDLKTVVLEDQGPQ